MLTERFIRLPSLSTKVKALLCCAQAVLLCAALTARGQTFSNPDRIDLPASSDLLIHGDLNGDGIEDLVYSDPANNPVTLHLLLGLGGGNYSPGATIALPANTASGCRLGDFNGDGKKDIACKQLNGYQAAVVYLFGRGDGTFASPVTFALPNTGTYYNGLYIVAPGDLNGDGSDDLLAYAYNQNMTWPVLSDGQVGFRLGAGESYFYPTDFFFADVNGDGKIDALTAGPSVRLGNGDGTFKPIVRHTAAGSCVFADFDGDRKLDAACANQILINSNNASDDWTLNIFRGNNDGTFSDKPIASQIYSQANWQATHWTWLGQPIAVADFNADGILDILCDSENGNVLVLGQPGLKFGEPSFFSSGASSSYILSPGGPAASIGASTNQWLVDDIDGDGASDIVALGQNGILLTYARRDRTLSTANASVVIPSIAYALVADFNSDGVPDIIADGSHDLSFAQGKGDGTFATMQKIDTGSLQFQGPSDPQLSYIKHGDFNGDGKEDIIAMGNLGTPVLMNYGAFYLQGKGDGTFAQPVTTLASGPTDFLFDPSSVIRDINKDGRADIINPLNLSSLTIGVDLSNGDGSFTRKTSPAAPLSSASGVPIASPAVGDYDSDGKLDLAYVGNNAVYLYRGKGDGTFSSLGAPLPISGIVNGIVSYAITSGDFDGDGQQDIAVLTGPYVANNLYTHTDNGDSVISVYFGRGNGTFDAPIVALRDKQPYNRLSSADFNRTGASQLVAHEYGVLNSSIGVALVRIDSARVAQAPAYYTAGKGLTSLEFADIRKSGRLDMVFANGFPSNPEGGAATVLLNTSSAPAVTGTLKVTPEPSALGDPFTVSTTYLVPDGAGVHGMVEFFVDGVSEGARPIIANKASIVITRAIGIGTHHLKAVWSGYTLHGPLELVTDHLISGISTSLDLLATPSKTSVGQAVTLTRTIRVGAAFPANITGSVSYREGGNLLISEAVTPSPSPNKGSVGLPLLGYGHHLIQATYSGDSTYYGSTGSTVVDIVGIDTSITATATPSTLYADEQSIIDGTLAVASGCAACAVSGTISITDAGIVTGSTAIISAGLFRLPYNALSAGDHTLHIAYSGDAYHLSSSVDVLVHVLRSDTAATLVSSKNPSLSGESISFTAHITNQRVPSSTPGGQVVFRDGTIILATQALNASGSAIYTTTALRAGLHDISASFTQTAALNTSTASLKQQVDRSPTSTTLTYSPNPVSQAQTLRLTATVTAVTGIQPGGMVRFLEGANLLGTSNPTRGIATFDIVRPTPANHTFTAEYVGDTETEPSSTAPLTVNVQPADFTLSAVPNSLIIRSGYYVDMRVMAQSVGQFEDDLVLKVSNLPDHMTVAPSPDTGHLPAGGQLTFYVHADTSELLYYRSAAAPQPRFPLTLAWLLAPFVLVFRNPQRLRVLLLVAASTVSLCTIGCSSHEPASVGPGNYTVYFEATGKSTGVSHKLALPVTVAP